MTKLNLKVTFLNLSKNALFYILFRKCFAIFFHYIKKFKHLSAKYYQVAPYITTMFIMSGNVLKVLLKAFDRFSCHSKFQIMIIKLLQDQFLLENLEKS